MQRITSLLPAAAAPKRPRKPAAGWLQTTGRAIHSSPSHARQDVLILHRMNVRLYEELQHLSVAERRALGEALIASADSEASAPLISDAQRAELRSRLGYHHANPGEAGVDFSRLKVELLATSR
jgi:putative addiction module component (TIGR02574 family)